MFYILPLNLLKTNDKFVSEEIKLKYDKKIIIV